MRRWQWHARNARADPTAVGLPFQSQPAQLPKPRYTTARHPSPSPLGGSLPMAACMILPSMHLCRLHSRRLDTVRARHRSHTSRRHHAMHDPPLAHLPAVDLNKRRHWQSTSYLCQLMLQIMSLAVITAMASAPTCTPWGYCMSDTRRWTLEAGTAAQPPLCQLFPFFAWRCNRAPEPSYGFICPPPPGS